MSIRIEIKATDKETADTLGELLNRNKAGVLPPSHFDVKPNGDTVSLIYMNVKDSSVRAHLEVLNPDSTLKGEAWATLPI